MKKDHKHIVIASPVRRMVVGCLLLLVFIGNAWAQSEVGFVIKMRMQNHYLAHVNENGAWTVKDAETVTPECIWYSDRTYNVSGTNHNYYFLDDDGNPHFLTGPLSSNGTLTVSSTMPPTYMLTNTDRDYYFYDWDWDHWPTDGAGVARGHQYSEANNEDECTACGGDWKNVGSTENPKYECWEVYWVELKQVGENNYKWELSQNQSYNITNASGRFRKVTIEKHEREVTQTFSGALAAITPFDMVYVASPHASHALNYTVGSFTYKYKPAYIHYSFNDFNPTGNVAVPHNHYYYNNTDNSVAPSEATESTTTSPQTYKWTITGDGASFLSFVDNASNPATESDLESPTLYYVTENTFGDKTATLTLTVTYDLGITQQVSTTVTVKTTCQSPAQASLVRTYDNVTVTWYPTADSYKVYLKKSSASIWSSVWEGTATTYTFTGLDANTPYDYKVTGICGVDEKPEKEVYHFTTKDAPDALILGAVFGGGRMADVNGKTEVIILNCDSITAVYGGNDIAGIVTHADGSNIVLGVDANDANATAYNDNNASVIVRIRDVYGGGNGYYAYNGSAFVAATDPDTPASVGASSSVMAQSASGEWNVPVWTNEGSSAVNLTIPKITKTAITVTNNVVKVDSIFGGAKNAFLTATSGNASGITVDGGTAFAVFGGNNYGGKSGAGTSKQYIEVNNTTVKTAVADYNASETGRDFGIRYLFGGGNKVAALGSDILIKGGQCDTVFAGGNSASVTTAAHVKVNCSLGNHTGDNTYGKTYSSAIDPDHYSSGSIGENTILGSYAWNGTGIYNVRALFGGNNKAEMNVLPTVTLTSGSVGTVYGGGNAGDMTAQIADGTGGPIATTFEPNYIGLDPLPIYYSTRVVMSEPTILVDYLYGGCQVSSVKYSTWVQVQDGHVGHVYGGCNISGDVGSEQRFSGDNLTSEQYQAVWGGTYVEVSGGTIYQNLIAGSNGYYHCNDGYAYIEGLDYADPEHYFIGIPIPTHNETHVVVSDGTVKGNVYAGGNMACVGFIIKDESGKPFPRFVGFASVRMSGGTVEGNVFGGGNMASIYGSNEVQMSGGTINGALYGGNDQLGTVANITNRVLPSKYDKASDNYTSLASVHTYISLTEKPKINTVYGGGNGAYTYTPDIYCNIHDHPIQSNTFVDINIDGSDTDPDTQARINKVFGGGNGVTVTGAITVFLNVDNPAAYDHVDTIFGGNNQGELADVLPDIILLKGRVNTVYGGCNSGPMTGSFTAEGYSNVGSRVHLRNSYPSESGSFAPTASVTGAVYGGCRMNSVTNNTLVLVEGGTHPANLFGGCDISGDMNTSQVVVTGGTVGNVYGGGNGNYDYEGHNVYVAGSTHNDANLVATSNVDIHAPICTVSKVDILGGQVGTLEDGKEVFGGGLGAGTSTTGNVTVNVGIVDAASALDTPIIYGNIYGGSALGSVNTNSSHLTQVNFLNGTLHGNLFGGGLGDAEDATKGKTFGQVEVNISNSTQDADNCFIDLRDANVYGCNNTNGSPQDNVTVNVYKTAHTATDYASYTESDATFAINNVFGGGKSASYLPVSDAKKATVNVFGCDNTIRRVFGGGDAASARGVVTNISGGRFYQVFGGGNGEVSPADIGDGGINLSVSGGTIYQLFGGNNHSGDISGDMNINVTNSGVCGESGENITEFFGGSNEAPMGSSNPVNLATTISCSTTPVNIATVYGGSNLADITGNVTLTIEGGRYTEVYAGSKGGTTAANINGSTTLNLYGGTMTNAFGGSNVNGNITGRITVNVLDYEDSCGLDITNIYGASNSTAYAPTDETLVSPIVNVMHIKQDDGIKGNVFGGGNLATVTANPQINIGYVADAILYETTTMSSQIPDGYSVSNLRAYVKGNVFGGGNNITVSGLGVTGNPVINMQNGTVVTDIYGGCNTSGTVTGNIAVNLTGGTVRNDVFGGGQGNATGTNGNITVTVDGSTVGRDVYGGSALGQVNNESTDLTKVLLKSGTITGNLYGGGMGDAGHNDYGQVNGEVEVHVNGGTIGDGNNNTGNVFGCNNTNGQPKSSVKVYIKDETAESTMNINGNIYGGGNVAYCESTCEVYIQNGTINNKVFGGGNNISIANKGVGGSYVEMTGGTVLGGIYGGCNTNGDVTGNSMVTITGGTIGATGEGYEANIHGGGYGQNTTVAGNVTVNFGKDDNTQDSSPLLYGAVYGGSALGSVNTGSSDLTTVNIHNGTIIGSVYGGGLGDADNAAVVNGVVHVNIGTTGPTGKATLEECDIFGCNNVKGSPQYDVYVDIYQTAHTDKNDVGYFDSDRTYAIRQVFGGGNHADYNPNGAYLTHVRIHYCDNTVNYVYGGSNAASAYGVETIIEGGRFDEVFGGGNGESVPADIGAGGIGLNVLAGNVGFLFKESNKNGDVYGTIYEPVATTECLGGLFVDSYFFGTNEAEHYGDLDNIITCAEGGSFEYRYVYAGSRWGIIYGNVRLTVCGGTIENLFGGGKGYIGVKDYLADIRRFPTFAELYEDYQLSENQRKYSDALRTKMGFNPATYNPADPTAGEPSYAGHGGNVDLVIVGGTIGNVYGGCDVKGNVEGRITVTINDAEASGCPLFVGNVYGGCNLWNHEPMTTNLDTPEVMVLKGNIGGVHNDLPVNNINGVAPTVYAGNVFGGGNVADVIKANPKVIVGDGTTGSTATPVTIKGDVYGGGNLGNIVGNPKVVIVPERHTLNIASPSDGNVVQVTSTNGEAVTTGDPIGEDFVLNLKAIPAVSQKFTGWTVSPDNGGTVTNASAAVTTFTMGTADAATITAHFVAATPRTLSYAVDPPSATGCTITVKDAHNQTVSSGASIGESAVLTITATPDVSHNFTGWTVSPANGGTFASATSTATTFTMGAADAPITAHFEAASMHPLTFGISPTGTGTITVKDAHNQTVSSGASIGKGSVLSITAAVTNDDYTFGGWTITNGAVANAYATETTFTMGDDDAEITANFVHFHPLTITPPVNGTIKVTDALGQTVATGDNIGGGALLKLKATPAAGYAFKRWTLTGTGATIVNPNAPLTSVTMGTGNTTLEAEFVVAHSLTITPPEHGTIKVTNVLGYTVNSGDAIGKDAVLNIVATPSSGYRFTEWSYTGGTIDTSVIPNTFTMGTTDATIQANFEPISEP